MRIAMPSSIFTRCFCNSDITSFFSSLPRAGSRWRLAICSRLLLAMMSTTVHLPDWMIVVVVDEA